MISAVRRDGQQQFLPPACGAIAPGQHKASRTFGYRVSDGRRALAEGADVLVHDAQLLAEEEVPAEAAFGHAAARRFAAAPLPVIVAAEGMRIDL